MTTTYSKMTGCEANADKLRPTHIPLGTVAARIQSFQKSVNRSRDENHGTTTNLITTDRTDVKPVTLETGIFTSTGSVEFDGNRGEPPLNTAPFPTPTSTRSASSLDFTLTQNILNSQRLGGQRYLSDSFDGPSQLTAVRSRLRSITERNESHQSESEGHESVMSELGNLLQDAIDQQNDTRTHEPASSTRAQNMPQKSEPPLLSSPNFQPSDSLTFEALDRPDPDIESSSQYVPGPQFLSRSSVDSETTRKHEHSIDKGVQKPVQDASIDYTASLTQDDTGRDFDLPAQNLEQSAPPRVLQASTVRHFPPRLPFFPRYRSNSVDEAGISRQNRERGRISRQLSLDKRKDHMPTSRPLSSHSVRIDDSKPKHLLPLTLPHIIEGRDRGRHVGEAKFENTVTHSSHSDPVQTDRQLRETIHLEHKPSSRMSHLTTHKMNPHDTTSSYVREAQALEPEGKRPSVIESKIQNLLAAAKKHDIETQEKAKWTAKPNKVRGGLLKENIRGPFDIGTKNLATFQIPINEQATLLHDDGMKRKSTKSFIHPTKTTPSPVRILHNRSNSTVETPIRPRSRQVRESLSPRGSAYTFEQRFAISPSRSQSRATNNAVCVSVELRRSPGRTDGDDQLLFVRASVEPEDSEEPVEPTWASRA